MKTHLVRTHRSAEEFPKHEHLAWKIAEVATDPVEVPADTAEMIVNRIIDDAPDLVTRPGARVALANILDEATRGLLRLTALIGLLAILAVLVTLFRRNWRGSDLVLVGAVIAGMQAVSQLYIPDKLERASQLYGAIGLTLVFLGWFFFLGRAMVSAMTLDAVIYERFGSISQLVFGLPLVRIIPRKSAWIRNFFDLDR